MERLYRETGPQLLAYFGRRHRSAQLAEDLLQETFAAVIRRPDGLRSAASPRAYLFGVARNLSLEAYRERAMAELPVELPFEPSESRADARLDQMREAILKLTPALREVLELRLQSELSYDEIAMVLAVPVGTVRSRLHHAVKQLRRVADRTLRMPPDKQERV